MCLETAGYGSKRVALDQTLYSAASDMSPHCLPRPVCTFSIPKYGIASMMKGQVSFTLAEERWFTWYNDSILNLCVCVCPLSKNYSQ